MSNLTIKATAKLRGELILPTLKSAITNNGKEHPISEDNFWKEDVQKALDLKLIEPNRLVSRELGDDDQERHTIQSLHKSPLILPSIPVTLTLGKTFRLSGRILRQQDIQHALTIKLIRLVDETEVAAEKEGVDEIVAQLKLDEAPKQEAEKEDVDLDLEMLDDAEKFRLTGQAQVVDRETPKTPKGMLVYDPHNELGQKKGTPQGMLAYDPHSQERGPLTADEKAFLDSVPTVKTTETGKRLVSTAHTPGQKGKAAKSHPFAAKAGPKPSGKGKAKGIKAVGRVKTAASDLSGEETGEEDGIELTMLTNGHSRRI